MHLCKYCISLRVLFKQSKKYTCIGIPLKLKWRILSKAHNIGMSLYIFFKEEINFTTPRIGISQVPKIQ